MVGNHHFHPFKSGSLEFQAWFVKGAKPSAKKNNDYIKIRPMFRGLITNIGY